jgi:nuclease S1
MVPFLALLVVLCTASPAWSWGCEGHETAALIAEHHLTAHARRMVHDLLEPSPIDPHLQRSCHPQGMAAIADASTWADDVRHDDTSPLATSGPWHYIDIPRGASRADVQKSCPARRGCLLSALRDQLAVLRADGTARGRKAEALMLVIHLVADLHQPLHCATNNDLGGNCVPVAYFGLEPRLSPGHPESAVYEPSLHAVWDTNIVHRITGRRTSAWFADFLERQLQSRIPSWQQMPVDLDEWAWESHEVAEQTAYGGLPVAIRAQAPRWVTQCTDVSPRMLKLHERLAQPYQERVAPVIEEQLAKAGVRLAMVLNQLWP